LADIFFFCCSCWWPIAGTGRLSLHSFGIAVDFGGPRADYRLWGARANDGRFAWRSRIHWEIVEVFKRHGFIWGGQVAPLRHDAFRVPAGTFSRPFRRLNFGKAVSRKARKERKGKSGS
jgi:hypothetical protein